MKDAFSSRKISGGLETRPHLLAHARRLLAETLLRRANDDEQTIVVSTRRLHPDTQRRLNDLMDRNNEGQLNVSEREELTALVARYQAIVLHNTEALLKANYPELFTGSGRLSHRRLRQSFRKQLPQYKLRSSSQ